LRSARKFRELAGSKADFIKRRTTGICVSCHRGSETSNCCTTADCNDIEKRVSSLESKNNTILQFIEADGYDSYPIAKKERPSRDLNPSRSLDRAFTVRSTSKALLAGLCIIVLLAAFGLINITIEITLSLSYISEYAAASQRSMTLTIWRHLRANQKPLIG
jgi:hypothetical protein